MVVVVVLEVVVVVVVGTVVVGTVVVGAVVVGAEDSSGYKRPFRARLTECPLLVGRPAG
jgi:hypothetical protein